MTTITPSGKVARSSATSPSDVITQEMIDERTRSDPMFKNAPPANRSSLQRILRYENEDVVARIMEDENLSHDEAYRAFKEALRFLWGTQNGQSHVPSEEADKGWHSFLLFTMAYQKFCFKFFSKFIHHRPMPLAEMQRRGIKGAKCDDLGSNCYSCSEPSK